MITGGTPTAPVFRWQFLQLQSARRHGEVPEPGGPWGIDLGVSMALELDGLFHGKSYQNG